MSQEQLFDADETLTVGQLGQTIRMLFQQTFERDVWIRGQVRGINRHGNGNVYFDLVEPDDEPGRPPIAKLPVVLLRDTKSAVNRQIKAAGGGLRIDDGVELRIRAQPEFYPPTGRISLRMSGIDPAYTLGRLQADRARLLANLRAEDLLDRNGTHDLAALPLRVGLVTAAGSAAAADFLTELTAVGVAFQIVHVATQVQGQGAHDKVARAISTCDRRNVDVIAVVRGGGARTDLAAFDHESVAYTIARCSVPVLTGIGHEVDRSVADDVAHQSFKTPTACAQFLAARVLEAEAAVELHWQQIVHLAGEHLRTSDEALVASAVNAAQRSRLHLAHSLTHTTSAAHRVGSLTAQRLGRARSQLTAHQTRTHVATRHCTTGAARQLDHLAERLCQQAPRGVRYATQHIDRLDEQRRLLDPAHTLARGWSITRTEDGAAIRSVADIAPGQTLLTQLADGTVASTANATDAHGEQQ